LKWNFLSPWNGLVPLETSRYFRKGQQEGVRLTANRHIFCTAPADVKLDVISYTAAQTALFKGKTECSNLARSDKSGFPHCGRVMEPPLA
jgi:hypothetical protein